MKQVKFAPRRLGHVNLWVAALDRSIAFYERVCGIEFVRLEREIRIGFHSNGNTHHGIGMVETSKGIDRYGRNGILQIPKTPGLVPGLNHLGREMRPAHPGSGRLQLRSLLAARAALAKGGT